MTARAPSGTASEAADFARDLRAVPIPNLSIDRKSGAFRVWGDLDQPRDVVLASDGSRVRRARVNYETYELGSADLIDHRGRPASGKITRGIKIFVLPCGAMAS